MQVITWEDNPWDVTACINAFELFNTSKDLSLDFFQKMSGFMVTRGFLREEITGIRISELLVNLKIADSISDANRKIKSGGIKLNKVQITNINLMVDIKDLQFNHWILIQFGKSIAGIVFVSSQENTNDQS